MFELNKILTTLHKKEGMKLISWNVNGIRAVAKKGFFDFLDTIQPDILCLQETKAQDEQVAEVFFGLENYHVYYNSAEKKGYSGTAILTKQKPISINYGIGISDFDTEGRVIKLEFKKYSLVNVYVPNSGSELKRLGYRTKWDLAFLNFLKQNKTKPLIICGDFNVAHKAIDLARPKANYNKSAGYMQEEIDGMDRYTSQGFVDTFRYFHPNIPEKYSWWSYRAGARSKNVGWRIDYFLVSEEFIPSVKNAFILNEVMGSDHCPVGIEVQQQQES